MDDFDFDLTMARSLYHEMAVCVPPADYNYEEAMRQFQHYGTKVAMRLRDTNTISSKAAVDLALEMITAGQHVRSGAAAV